MSKIAETKALEAYPKAQSPYYDDHILDRNVNCRAGYIKGYDQAMQEFLEKACEWLVKNAQKYMPSSYSILPPYDTHNMIHDLKNYMEEVPAFIEGADFALKNQWISVEEALPTLDEKYDFSERYLVKTNEGAIKVMRIFRNIAWCDIYDAGAFISFEKKIVTHWMPIPSLEGGEK